MCDDFWEAITIQAKVCSRFGVFGRRICLLRIYVMEIRSFADVS